MPVALMAGPMEQRTTEEIERFLAGVGQSSLLAYYGIDASASAEEREEAVKKKRAWAQGQQSNPKFKAEALFLIKQNAMLRRVVVLEPDTYRQVLEGVGAATRIEAWKARIREAAASGVLTARAGINLQNEGARLDLNDASVAAAIEAVLAELGATRSGEARDELSLLVETDLYAVLHVPVNASPDELEAAHRARYKWARNLNDIKRSQDELNRLDRAWRVLSQPARRAAYDQRRAERQHDGVMGLLGPGAPSTAPTDPGYPVVEPDPDTEVVAVDHPPPPPAGLQSIKPVTRPPIALPPPEDTPVRSRAVPEPEMPPRAVTEPASPPPFEAPEVSDPRGAPPPPPGTVGRTIGAAAGPLDLGRRAPRLAVGGPDVVSVSGRARPSLTVRNAGSGRMPGRVTSDREWLEVPRPALDPTAAEQTIPLVYRPDSVPWGRDVAMVTVVGDHGERKSVQFRAFRFPWGPVLGSAATFVALVAAFVALFWYMSQSLGDQAGLSITVHPRADHIYVNGEEVGQGRHVEVKQKPPFEQVRVRVQTDGFEQWERPVSLTSGRTTPVDAQLKLDDPMDWGPPQEAQRVPLAAEAEPVLEALLPELGACFRGTGIPGPVVLTWTLLVDTTGHARNVQFADSTAPHPGAEACMRAVLRATPLPPVRGGYGFHQKRVQLTVPA